MRCYAEAVLIMLLLPMRAYSGVIDYDTDRSQAKRAFENNGRGDILRTTEDRNAVIDRDLIWPNGVVYYTIQPKLARRAKPILRAMKALEERSCVRFVPRTNQTDYINMNHGKYCMSAVGRIGGEQPLQLGSGCIWHGVILHELLHALGFDHEHTRVDRDEYLIVYRENINPDDWDQFEKQDPSEYQFLNPFDYDSVMLYGSTSFTKNDRVHSVTRKDGSLIPEPYDRKGLSESDVYRLNRLYRCPRRKPAVRTTPRTKKPKSKKNRRRLP